MTDRNQFSRRTFLPLPLIALAGAATMSYAQPLPKARVADLIRQVEDGVDEFRDYLERRGDSAREKSSNAQSQASQSGRTSRRKSSGNTGNTEARKEAAREGKDELDDALGDLNQSTNRLRRKFDATPNWMETKVQVERMLDDGRRINQAVTRGNYGSDVARLWATLRTRMNELARTYGLTPLGV